MGPGILASELRGIPTTILDAEGLLLLREGGNADGGGKLKILHVEGQLPNAQKLQRICKIRMLQAPPLQLTDMAELRNIQGLDEDDPEPEEQAAAPPNPES